MQQTLSTSTSITKLRWFVLKKQCKVFFASCWLVCCTLSPQSSAASTRLSCVIDCNHYKTACVCRFMVCLKTARKNVLQNVKNELNGHKKCGGQRAQIREVQGTCPTCTSCPLRTYFGSHTHKMDISALSKCFYALVTVMPGGIMLLGCQSSVLSFIHYPFLPCDITVTPEGIFFKCGKNVHLEPCSLG